MFTIGVPPAIRSAHHRSATRSLILSCRDLITQSILHNIYLTNGKFGSLWLIQTI